jgi:hypothetical protein
MITLSASGRADHAVHHFLPRRMSTAEEGTFQTLQRCREGEMPRRKWWTIAVLAMILAWSTVMTALGQLAAVLALLPSLGLLVHQLAVAVHGSATVPSPAPVPEPTGQEEPR